jgi:hypothetical protein
MEITKCTGFQTPDRRIFVTRLNEVTGSMEPFYLFTNTSGGMHRFNLPRGTYKTENKISATASPAQFSKIKLPAPDAGREHLLKRPMKIFFAENPNKCSINFTHPQFNIITFDNSFKDGLYIKRMAILGHEFGHFFFVGGRPFEPQTIREEREYRCDCFSYNYLITIGFNPSQIYVAFNEALTGRNRPSKLLEQLKTFAKNA